MSNSEGTVLAGEDPIGKDKAVLPRFSGLCRILAPPRKPSQKQNFGSNWGACAMIFQRLTQMAAIIDG